MNPDCTPNRCQIERRTPKVAPDRISSRLLGPGVIEATKANMRQWSDREVERVHGVNLRFRRL